MPGTECVKVVVRVRPLSEDELARRCNSVVQADEALSQVTITNNKTLLGTTFAFNAVFGPETGQQQVYDQTVFPLVESVLEGYNGTIFAYGQTGCGKTYTMSGESTSPGVIPNSFKHLFSAISDTDKSKCFLVRCSYMEIYNEEIRDLLRFDLKSKLELKEGKEQSVFVKGLTTETVNTISDLTQLMEIGGKHRTTKETMMNDRSSRSHAIFTVYLEMSEEIDGRQVIKAGKLNLVDLAGSERQKKTHAQGDRLREAIEINLSLSALGNVISALVDGSSSHIPYRDSKLTRLLQDSLGGNTKTIMVAVVSPADYNVEESLSTLRYASRAKRIQNKPKVNEDPKDALLRAYAEEIANLKRKLAEKESGQPVIIEKIVERERIVERRVPTEGKKTTVLRTEELKQGTKTDNSKKTEPGNKPGTKKRKNGGRTVVALEDDSDEETESAVSKVSEPAPKLAPRTNTIEDDSSDSDVEKNRTGDHTPTPSYPKYRPIQGADTQRSTQSRSSSGLKPQAESAVGEEEYELDAFDEEATEAPKKLVQKPTISIVEKPTSRDSRKMSQSPAPGLIMKGAENPVRAPDRKVSKGSDGTHDNPWLRPASGAEDRNNLGKRTSSNEPSAREKGDVVIRSNRSPAIRKPVKAIVEEENRGTGVQSRTQHRQPSGVNLGIAEVNESSEGEDSPEVDVLASIKEKLIRGGHLIEESEQERLKEYHQLQLQLQIQKGREEAFQEQHRQQEEDLLLKERQYQNLAEEVEEQRKVIKALRAKYKASLAEVEDLNHEREGEKEEMLDSIRSKDVELAFFHKLVGNLLAADQLSVVKQKSHYDEDNRDWVIPPFMVQQNKQTVFPKLPKRQAQELMENGLKARAVVISGEEETEEAADDTLKKYQWVTHADPRPMEIDNRPPTSGHRSRQLMSRHSKNVLLDPIPGEKAPSNTFPASVSYDQAVHSTPLSKKRTLKPHPLEPPAAVRLLKKSSEIS